MAVTCLQSSSSLWSYRVPRCRTASARLARRVIGIPAGIARVAVTCTDAAGTEHVGQARHREV